MVYDASAFRKRLQEETWYGMVVSDEFHLGRSWSLIMLLESIGETYERIGLIECQGRISGDWHDDPTAEKRIIRIR